jgi:putative oxidoreductase
MSKKQLILEGIAALLIMLFLYASISKFIDFKRFIEEIDNQPLPNSWTPFIVWSVPFLEIAISTAVAFEYSRLLGFYASLVMMIIFTIYSILVLTHFFPYIPCSCGGVIRKLSWPQHLVLNLFYVALSVLGLILQRSKHFKSIIITKNSFV